MLLSAEPFFAELRFFTKIIISYHDYPNGA